MKRGDESGYDDSDRYFERYQPEELRTLVDGAGMDPFGVTTGDGWVQVLANRTLDDA